MGEGSTRNTGVDAGARRWDDGGGYPETVSRLLDELSKLPGIGKRSAERLAFHILKATAGEAERLAGAIVDVKRSVRHCSVCYTLTDEDPCRICGDASRDRGLVLVVEQPKDAIALERTGMYRGVFHVLMGALSPLDGVGPGELTVDALLRRVDNASANCGGEAVREVVLGMNPNLEGDGTALYLSEALSARGVSVSRLARGLPAGSSLEFANKAVLADALAGRRPVG